MAGLSDLARWLFGVDELDNSRQQDQAKFLQDQSTAYSSREATDYARQLDYIQELERVAQGTAGPSAAERAAVAGQDAAARAGQAATAGATGNSAALGRYGAVLSTADTNGQVLQQLAIQRAQEAERARLAAGQAIMNQGQRSASLFDVAMRGGLGYQQAADAIAIQNNRADAALAGTLLSTAGSLGAAALGAPTAPVVPAAAAGAAPASAVNGYSAAQPGLEASRTAGPAPISLGEAAGVPTSADYSRGLYDPYGYSVGGRGH